MPKNAVYVGRPTLWGNPWIARELTWLPPDERRASAVRRYRIYLERGLHLDWSLTMGEYASIVLRGKDLACWCPLDQPCHADVLLELANR